MPTPWLPGAGREGGTVVIRAEKGRSGVCTARTEALVAAPRRRVCGSRTAVTRYELPRAGTGRAKRFSLSLQLLLKGSDEHCSDGGGGVRLSFHTHSFVCRYNLPQVKPLTLSLPLTPDEVRLVGRTNIYEIAGCKSRGKGEC